MLSVNYLLSKAMSGKYQQDCKISDCNNDNQLHIDNKLYNQIFSILNIDLIGGLCLVCIGSLSATDFFKGRRITLIAISIVINFTWNIIWLLLNNIDSDSRYTELSMGIFDRIMYRIDCSLTSMVYQIIFTVGPIDICKTHMLRNNQNIYGILICLLGAIKLALQGLFFDNLSFIMLQKFSTNRLIVILMGVLSVIFLVPIVIEEVGEIISN